MTIALSVLFAALVGGVVFALIDNVGRREAEPAEPWTPPAPPPEPEPEFRREGLWAGWARD